MIRQLRLPSITLSRRVLAGSPVRSEQRSIITRARVVRVAVRWGSATLLAVVGRPASIQVEPEGLSGGRTVRILDREGQLRLGIKLAALTLIAALRMRRV
jgi:hypothetical protein